MVTQTKQDFILRIPLEGKDAMEEETAAVSQGEEGDQVKLQETVTSMIRERPKDAVQLIRTWLLQRDLRRHQEIDPEIDIGEAIAEAMTAAMADMEAGKKKDLKDYTGRQKAAMFFVTIGTEISSEIFKCLSEDEVETLTSEITNLETIEPDEKDFVLQEFLELMMTNRFVSTGGIDFASELLKKSHGSQKAAEILDRLTSGRRPFDYIRRTDPAHLLNFIQQEHHQTIALVLSYLEPNKASVILENLPHEEHSDVARRIVTMDRVSPEILREVERVLEKKLSTLSSEDYLTSGGLDSIMEILGMVDKASEKKILEDLEDDDPELAEEIEKRLPFFKRCKFWWDTKLRSVLHEDTENSHEHATSTSGCSPEKPASGKKLLSQDELDQLLSAIKAGEAEPEDKAAVSNKIKIYDFKRPDKFTKEQITTISMMHDTFARLTTTVLSAQLRSMVHVHVESVEQLAYEEFIRSIPTPTTLAILNMDPLRGNAVLEIDPAVTFSIIDRLFGGIGEGTKLQHELTDIEAAVMEGIIVKILMNMQEAWTQVIDLRPRLGQIDTNPMFAQIVPPSEMVALVSLGIKINDVEGMINFCIPYRTIEPIIDTLPTRFWFESFEDVVIPAKKDTLVNREDMPVKLTAEILRRDYTLGEINAWKEETIILPLCPLTPDHCYLRLGDMRVWQCRMMDDEKWFPKKVVVVDQAKMPYGTEDSRMEINKANPVVKNALLKARMMITVELGATAKTVKEVLSIGEGSILELDKLAGEPLDVKANGVLIAKGEAVVIDENFGVRITETLEDLCLWAKEETTDTEPEEEEA
jgi:flagellar motor switch protein FliM